VAEGRGKLQAESNDERVHKYLNIAPGKPGDESFQSRAKGLSLVGHHPLRSTGDYSDGSGLRLRLGLGGWMSTAIVVTPSPYFAVTDQYGRFLIERLPAGEYEMETWHERLGSKNQRILVFESAQSSVEVVYHFNHKMP